MDLGELLDRIRTLMQRLADTDGIDMETVEFGDRLMSVQDYADLNLDALRDMGDDEHLITFEAAPWEGSWARSES